MAALFAGITKSGEGFTKEERDIPLDIQDQKLLQWLVSRGKVQANWKDVAIQIRAKIDDLVKTLPSEIPLPKSRELNYYDLDELMNNLIAGGESQEKSLFGSYTSRRLKAITDMKYYYEKNHVFLAEAAENIVQVVKYDIPELKKSMQQYQKQIQDLQRKEADHRRHANDALKQYEKACADMGIKGENVKSELIALQSSLPSLLSDAAALTHSQAFQDALAFYKTWTANSWKLKPDHKEVADEELSSLLGFEVLEFISKKGNTIIADYKEVKDPNYVRPKEEEIKKEEEPIGGADASGITINWDDTPDPSASALPVPSLSPEVINWDPEDAPKIDFGDEASINWDITVENEGEVQDLFVVAESGSASASTVTASDSPLSDIKRTLLEDIHFRREFLFALYELEGFFSHRLTDLKSAQDSTKIHLDQPRLLKFPELITKHNTLETMAKFLAAVKAVLDAISNDKVKKLLEMINSQTYVDRLAQSIHLKFDRHRSAESSAVESARRAAETEVKLKETYPKLQEAKEFALAMKAKVEASLSKLFDGRVVRITGEITTL